MFCQFDPKPKANHVCASILGADEIDLKDAGTVHNRKNSRPWVDIKDMRGAKLLERLILRAYAAAGVDVKSSCHKHPIFPRMRPIPSR